MCNLVQELTIGLDKSGYQVNIFLISPQKHMLWIFFRSADEYPQHMFLMRNKKSINTFRLKKKNKKQQHFIRSYD